jgi:hypothetical protein
MSTRAIVPRADGEGSLGTAAKKWGRVYADIVDGGDSPKTNLLTNTQWMAMSGSTLENVRALPDATSTVVGTTVSSDAHLLSAGMLVKDAAGTPLVFEVLTVAANSFTVDRAGGTDGQWYEVTPGYMAANTTAPDGWAKDNALDIWREHDGTNTKDGSFYSLKVGILAGTIWNTDRTDPVRIRKFAGRTATLGCFAKTSVGWFNKYLFFLPYRRWNLGMVGSINYVWVCNNSSRGFF